MWYEKPNGIRYLEEWDAGVLIPDRWYVYYNDGQNRKAAATKDELKLWTDQLGKDDPLLVCAGHHKTNCSYEYPKREELDAVLADLELVWNSPTDSTHLNDADCNLWAWAEGLRINFGSDKDRDKYARCWKRLRDTVAGRMKIRSRWISIIERMNLDPVDPKTEFRGFKHQRQFSDGLTPFLYESDLGWSLHMNGHRDRYAWYIKMYADAIWEKDPTLEQFKQVASTVSRGML